MSAYNVDVCGWMCQCFRGILEAAVGGRETKPRVWEPNN